MSLPPAEELARWTVGQVNNWLTQSSLTAFRDDFLRDGVDGSKLMRIQLCDVDGRFPSVPLKKKQILKDYLSRIESPKSPPSWNPAAPQLPPRSGGRPAAPLPQQQDEGDASDDGWGSEFEDDIEEEYLEPTTTPEHIKQAQSSVQQNAPPPRPPRIVKGTSEAPSYTNTQSKEQSAAPAVASQPPSGRHRPPQHVPPAQKQLPPEDFYEVVNSSSAPAETEDAEYVCPETATTEPNNYLDFSDTCKKPIEKKEPKVAPGGGGEAPLPPRPVKKVSADKPPQTPAQQGGWLFNNEQPTTPAAKGDDLSSYNWYHGKISRDHAQSIFHREQKDGMFLIRKSEREPQQPYTLVLWHCNRIWNIPIRKVDNGNFAAGKYKEGETYFSTLPDLVEHFKVVSLNLKSDDQVQGSHNLTVPAPKQ